MIIMGIDPGLATVGYGFVEFHRGQFRTVDYGAVLTPAGKTVESRLSEIYDNITELLQTYKPQAVSIEKLFFNNNEKTAIDVSEARGVIVLAVYRCGVPIYEYTPLQIKQAVTGYGRAEKAQIMYMVKKMLGLAKEPRPDDTADALAAAICHAYSSESALFGLPNG